MYSKDDFTLKMHWNGYFIREIYWVVDFAIKMPWMGILLKKCIGWGFYYRNALDGDFTIEMPWMGILL